MGLRFFTDHCVPNAVISRLRDAGHPVFVLRDHIPTDSDDPVVIAKAQELDTILVSLNGDFSDIVMYPPSHYKGIVALQVKNRPEALPVFMDRLMKYVTAHPEMGDYAGRLFWRLKAPGSTCAPIPTSRQPAVSASVLPQ